MSDTHQTKELVKLSLPESRFINSYSVAYNMVDAAVLSHDSYWKVIKACEEHIAGKKPNPPDELKKKGMLWAYNFNYGKAQAKIQKGVAESISKLSSALALGYVTFRAFNDDDKKDEVLSFLEDESKRGVVASIIGYALTSTLAKETRLSGWMNDVEYPSYAFGYCAVTFDKFDWMPTPVHPLNIAFGPNTKAHDIKDYVVFRTMEASELFDRWVKARNESITEEGDDGSTKKKIVSSGWNLVGLEKVLLKAFKGKININGTSGVPAQWAEVIPSFINDPSSVMVNTESVSIAKIYHKELNGTLSEVYIPWGNSWQQTENKTGATSLNSNNESPDMLFSKNHGAFIQDNHISIVRDSGFTSSGGTIQDMRGIAAFSVEDSVRYNRNRNALGNKMIFVGSPMFEQSNTGSGDKFKVTVSQGFIMLPTSHQLIEKQPSFDIGSHINMLRFEEGEFNRDTQQFDASIQGRLTSRPNKGEVEQVTSEVQFTEAAKNNIKFRDYAAVFKTVIKRIPTVTCKKTDPGYTGKKAFYDILKKNLKWLIKSDADLNKILACVDSYVMDPIIADVATITMALQMAETPYARNRLKRMLLIAKGFPIEEVNSTVPLIIDKFTNMQDSRLAAFENDMFFTTNEIIMAGTDDHIIHIESHFAKQEKVIKGVREGGLTPLNAFKFLENSQMHTIEHIDALGKDPIFNKQATDYMATQKDLIEVKDQIKNAAQKMMEQEQQEQGKFKLDPQTEAKIASDNVKTQSDIERKNMLMETRTAQRDKQIDLSHEQAMRKIELDNEVKRNEQ